MPPQPYHLPVLKHSSLLSGAPDGLSTCSSPSPPPHSMPALPTFSVCHTCRSRFLHPPQILGAQLFPLHHSPSARPQISLPSSSALISKLSPALFKAQVLIIYNHMQTSGTTPGAALWRLWEWTDCLLSSTPWSRCVGPRVGPTAWPRKANREGTEAPSPLP